MSSFASQSIGGIPPGSPALQLTGITKRCGNGVLANHNISLSIATGEIHAVVGENGAGKSTLLQIAAGLQSPDAGTITIEGSVIPRLDPALAIAQGIGMVQQHFALIPTFTVAENVVLGQEPRQGLRLDRTAAETSVRALARGLGFELEPSQRVSQLSVGAQQRVEILKLLYRQARILILDEPTAVLAPSEVDELFALLKAWVKQGRTVVLVTHKLSEVMAIADRVTVLRRGTLVATLPARETSVADLAARMVEGASPLEALEAPAAGAGRTDLPSTAAPRLWLQDFSVRSPGGRVLLEPLSLSLHSGEILGVAGVQGNGQTELVEALAGLLPFSGEARLDDHPLLGLEVQARQSLGLAHIPEDRQARGLVLGLSLRENLALGRLSEFSHRTWLGLRSLDFAGMNTAARAAISHFDIRPPDAQNLAGSLSGGNQQKVVVARELQRLPKVLLAAQPTRGVDIGAMAHIHQALLSARQAGTAILLVSADLQELLRLSDRIAVLHRGRLMGILSRQEANERRLGALMLGAPAAADAGGASESQSVEGGHHGVHP